MELKDKFTFVQTFFEIQMHKGVTEPKDYVYDGKTMPRVQFFGTKSVILFVHNLFWSRLLKDWMKHPGIQVHEPWSVAN